VAGGRRRWGWHQLDPGWAARLVADAGVGPGDRVLDVGAGSGAITRPLVAAGARVIVVELHPGRAATLRRRFADGVVVVQADAADLRLPRRPFHVVANPPFDASSALVRRLVQPGSRLVSAHLVVQEPFARRWAGPEAPAVGRWGRSFVARLGPRVPRSAFTPSPRVDARILVVERRCDRRPVSGRPGGPR
jgi:23S rRNA (adenine-N6)-dimethyltransferase